MAVWSKVYAKVGWQNKPSRLTPLGKSKLQIHDDALDIIDDRVLELNNVIIPKLVDKYKDIPNPIDLNTLTETGFYSIPNLCTNIPSGANGGGQATVQVISTHVSSTNAYIVQIFYNQLQADNVQQVYFRIGYGTIESPTFLSWQIMAVSSDLKRIAQGIGNMWDLGSYANVSLLYSLGFPTHMYPAAQQGSNAYALDVLSGTVYKNTRMGEYSYTWVEQTTLSLKTDSIPDVSGTKTVTGNPITLSDSAPVNAVNVSVNVEPIQDLHGYSYPWVGGSGKNKMPITVDGIKLANTSGTWNGNAYTVGNITFTILTDSDGNVTGIKTSGTTSSGETDYLYLTKISTLNTILSGSYILTGCPNGGSLTSYRMFLGSVGGEYGEGLQFSTPLTGTNCGISIYENTDANNLIFYPMIRLSTETDSTFTPYENKASISGRTELDIDRVGVNLFNKNDVVIGKTINSEGNLVNSSQQVTSTSGYIKVTPNTNYYLSTYNDGTNRRCAFYDKNKNVISVTSAVAGSKALTTPLDCLWCRVSISTANIDTTQLELGTTATTYEPYQGKTYTIQFGQTVYGGRLDVTRGKLIITDGYISSYNGETLPSTWISDRDKYESGTIPTTGAEVVYKLATPIEIDLTPTQIKMLENTNTLYTDYEGDTIHIEYQPNNAIGEAVRAVEESYDAIIQNLIDRVTALENQ